MRVTPIQSITNMKNNTKKQLTKEDISDILKMEVEKLNKKGVYKNDKKANSGYAIQKNL